MVQTAKRFFWKIWLRLNLLTKDTDNDYIAEVSRGKKSIRNSDIARIIVEEGSEIKYETLLSILNRNDEIIRRQLQLGNSVLTGTAQYTPRVSGTWLGSSAQFNPELHKITLDIVPGFEMHQALAEVGVEILGVRESGAFIGLVTDTLTRLTDGSITAGEDIRIDGHKIRIAPEDEAGLGVFFIDSSGVSHPVTRTLTRNDPKTLLARVPVDLPVGEYSLHVVTRFTSGNNLLKEPRTIEYEKFLFING
jgi:hypothetical protein